jgi:SRSO17 transposase
MALAFDLPIRGMQAIIVESQRAAAPLLRQQQALAAQTLGAEEDVLLIDESGMPKQRLHSAAVARQCDTLGKVTSCQVGVFLVYTTRKGYTIIDGQLFVPECWFEADHQTLRAEVEMPPELTFQTKPQLAVQLLQTIHEWGVLRARWVATDAFYGNSPAFRDVVAAMGY